MPPKKKNRSVARKPKGWQAAAAAAAAKSQETKIHGRMKRKITATRKQKKIKKSRETPTAEATPATSSPAATASSADSADALVPAAVLAAVQAAATTAKIMTANSPSAQATQARKRPKKPSVNTCLVAKSRTVTEFIGNNHGGNASVKLTALQGLCLISEVNKWSITCPVCNGSIRSKKQVSYDLHEPASQVETVGKYMVRLIRQHCEAVHPNTWVWNVVVPTRIKEDDGISPYEHFLHQALKAGALHGYIPKALTAMEFCSAFCIRIGSALSWIRWSRMMNKRLNKLQRIEALREDATRRIENILDDGMARFLSPDFAKVLETHTLDQAFNKLMLFFCEMGRYRYCPIFGMQINELQAVAMLNSRLTRGENIRGNEADISQIGVDDA